MTKLCVLAIGGSDATGAAGIAADVLTIAAHGVHPALAITAVTAQDDSGVRSTHAIPAASLRDQLDVVRDACRPAVIKTGMLCNAGLVEVVAAFARELHLPLVIDPVIAASSGSALIDAEGLLAMRELLIPLATLVTPNIDEAALLVPGAVGPEAQAEALLALGARWVVITGGHSDGPPVELLVGPKGARHFEGERIETDDDRGTGCSFASAVACSLAQGEDMASAVQAAGAYVRAGLAASYPLANARGTLKRI